jgi:hypothetical protein
VTSDYESISRTVQAITASIVAIVSALAPIGGAIWFILRRKMKRNEQMEQVLLANTREATATYQQQLQDRIATQEQMIVSLREELFTLRTQHNELLTEGARRWSELSTTAVQELNQLRPLLEELNQLRNEVQRLRAVKISSKLDPNIALGKIPRVLTSDFSKTK